MDALALKLLNANTQNIDYNYEENVNRIAMQL
jgi:hypothetical protein